MRKTIFSKFIHILFISILALSSCDGSVSVVDEVITVTPSSINLEFSSGQESVEVSANCRWTAEVKYAENSSVSWITLAKTAGDGDAVVAFRIMENRQTTERNAKIMFISAGGDTTNLSITQAGHPEDIVEHRHTVRIGTYNIRLSTMDDSSVDNNWDTRKERLWASIKDNDFDLFGLQEVSTEAQRELKNKWADSYGLEFFSPYSQTGKGDKAQGIMYRRSKFSISDVHYYWIADNPDVITGADVTADATYYRGGMCAILTYKETGQKIFFMNSHGCLSKEVRDKYASLYEEMEKRYNTEGFPSFFVGDLNAIPTQPVCQTIATYWKDAYVEAESKEGPANTFNSFVNLKGLRRIDYIFYRGNVSPKYYRCDNTLYNGLFPSDHFPIYTDFEISD